MLKKKGIALVLTLLMVLGSTALSANIKLGKASQRITDGFYDGVYYDGYEHPSIAGQLKEVCGAAEALITIADRYKLDVSAADASLEDLKNAVAYSDSEIAHIHDCYVTLREDITQLEQALRSTSSDDRDLSGIDVCMSTINSADGVIDKAGYNESVRAFLRDELTFPANYIAELTGVEEPELFN